MSVSKPAPLGVDLPQVLDQARNGDGEAFRHIYERFARTVHGIVLARVGAEEAEDVTQDVFVAVHGGLATIQDPKSLPAWICTVARNMAIDHDRKRTRRPTMLRLVEDPEHSDSSDDHELAQRVLALIKGLPEAYRETLILRLVEGMTGPEIATHTGMTHGSVRVNLNRGMNLLRPLLRKEGWQ